MGPQTGKEVDVMSNKDERVENYTVAQIREAFAQYATPDSWGVSCHYENTLVSALRGEYDFDEDES